VAEHTWLSCDLRGMIDEDLAPVYVKICRVLAQIVERLSVIVLDVLTTFVVVAEERPEEVATDTFGFYDTRQEV
jgi:hypothetical protein